MRATLVRAFGIKNQENAEVGRLEAAIREVRDAIEAIDDEIAAAELQLKFLEGLARECAGSERWRINNRYEVSYPGDTVITELPENRSPGL